MTGLLVNMGLWKTLLKRHEFDAAVDHLAVVQILKAKTEPATPRIMRLLDQLSAYTFNLYFVKGKDMVWQTTTVGIERVMMVHMG